MTAAGSLDEDFLALAHPYRRELLAHCYRMMGSLHDAEDQLQETLIRAWRGYAGYQQQASLRTWLYKIATNTCLTALQSRAKRPLPSGLGAPDSDPTAELVERHEVPWLGPLPGRLIDDDASDPATIVTSRESVRLAFIAALQHLPPRQRSVLVLRDVLQWKASEVAEALDTSTTAVNSLLQRARTQLQLVNPDSDTLVEPDSAAERERLDRYVAAFENYDVDAIVALFTEDAVWEMPPFDGWYLGGEAIGRLVSTQCPANGPGDMRLLPTTANGQPAFGLYMRGEDGVHRPFQFHVLEVTNRGVSHVVSFFDVELFDTCGLPENLSS
ncbi:MAG: sigma-70 family RNA polymerase sigma factor [Rhodococcus sp. (in: high G+C Gram-positive bacteria)]|uniref:sigma-70 family RNA polymerase sigma factor n=2 Tax=Rhodococcus sp. TaxID=1831 RepID=UPI003BB00565